MSRFPILTFLHIPAQPPPANLTLGAIHVREEIATTSEPASVSEHDCERAMKCSRQRFFPSIFVTDTNNHTYLYNTGDEDVINITAAFELRSSSSPTPNGPARMALRLPKNDLLSIPDPRYPPTSSLHVPAAASTWTRSESSRPILDQE